MTRRPELDVAQVPVARRFAELETVPALLAMRAALTPGAPAHFTNETRDLWRPTTWAQFTAAVDHVAAGLLEIGLTRGTRIAILAGTSQDWEVCQMAALQLGAAVIGIDPYYPAEQVNRIIAELDPLVVAVGDPALLLRVDSALQSQRRMVLMSGEAPANGLLGLDELKKRGAKGRAASESAAPVRGEDPALIIFSSGTTGVPKRYCQMLCMAK